MVSENYANTSELRELRNCFDRFFSSCGYTQLKNAGITSGIDKTVYLTNSATNLFKLHFSDDGCFFARQRSMRTQTLCDFYDEKKENEYPTYFVSYGVFAPVENFEKLISDTIAFHIRIGFSQCKMRLRISSKETFLLPYVKTSCLNNQVFLDDKDSKFDHSYGANICGRAIKLDYYQDTMLRYKNLGYFLVITKGDKILGCEYASSDQLILMRQKEIKYGISVSSIADILETSTFSQRRFADSIVGAAHLLYEGIRPTSSNTNGRTLKKYVAALSYYGTRLSYSVADISKIIKRYLEIEYGHLEKGVCEGIDNSLMKIISSV